jgi:NitT/TauT family transport system permease protein
MTQRQIGLVIALLCLGAALAQPLGGDAHLADAPLLLAGAVVAAGTLALALRKGGLPSTTLCLVAAVVLAAITIALLAEPGVEGRAGAGFWSLVVAAWLSATEAVAGLSGLRPRTMVAQRAVGLIVPLLFGAFLFYLWEVMVRGFGVPPVLMPAPSAIFSRFVASLPTLGADFVQTFVRGVLSGYVIGCAAGFLAAILADRIPFLQRGLLPLGNFVSALPIVGIAPIMVMWFGFDWPSKAAVVVVMTFFPMLVNTVTGLSAAGHIERDLMRSYGAGYWQTLFKLRLPAAMPFVFNALKINSTLALIGAIVAEFFGTPVVGMGFRISIEVARMSLDMVWAEIALAALAGTAFYGVVALAERAATFWHPSYRT